MKLSGDDEENPGSKPGSSKSFSICHWNLSSISAHNYIKLSLVRAYVSTHKFDIICISGTYLNSDTSTVDENLEIIGYTLITADHSSNTKRRGVCIYYKHSLAFRLLDICYLDDWINFEISFSGKLCKFISLYPLPSQSPDVFEKFSDNFELNLDKIANKNRYLIVIPGEFNAKSSNWYEHDMTRYKGSKINAITSQFGLKQLIQGPTHVLNDSSSCIDLIFTSKPNFVIESGVNFSLHQNCHHQLIYAKVNLKVFYPPPHEHEIWHYHCANADQIQQAIEQFSWEKAFRNLNIDEMVVLFKKTIKFFFQSLFPTEQALLMTEIHLGSTTTSSR